MIETVRLSLAKQLKAAGFPQRSELSWVGITQISAKLVQYPYPTEVSYAAPTAEEILERLPALLRKSVLNIFKFNRSYAVRYDGGHRRQPIKVEGETLAEAAGKMWLYLKTHNLLGSEHKQD